MMANDVKHIAKLSKLDIKDSELEKFEKEFSAIIKMVEKLPEMDCKVSLLDTENVMELREDVIIPSLPRDEITKNAPKAMAGCFVVPKTVE